MLLSRLTILLGILSSVKTFMLLNTFSRQRYAVCYNVRLYSNQGSHLYAYGAYHIPSLYFYQNVGLSYLKFLFLFTILKFILIKFFPLKYYHHKRAVISNPGSLKLSRVYWIVSHNSLFWCSLDYYAYDIIKWFWIFLGIPHQNHIERMANWWNICSPRIIENTMGYGCIPLLVFPRNKRVI